MTESGKESEMRLLLCALCNFCLLVLLSCSPDGPAEPDNNQGKPLATVSIGPAGGALETDQFELTVPEGAFANTIALSLYADTINLEGAITDAFRVEGFPNTFSESLRISIKHTGTESGTSHYIAAGTEAFDISADNYQPALRMFQAGDSSGSLMAEIPILQQFTFLSSITPGRCCRNQDSPFAVYFMGVSGYDPPITKPHFRIVLASDLGTDAKTILPDLLEKTLDTLIEAGLSISRTPFPIEVYALNFPAVDNARYCTFYPAWGAFTLVLDQTFLDDFFSYGQFIKGAVTRELAHCVSCTYDNQYFNVILPTRSKINPAHFWLHHAIASWFEERMVGTYVYGEDFSPLDFDRTAPNERQPFAGIQAGCGITCETSRRHGGGMSALMKYLEINYDQSYAWRILNDLRQNHSHPVTAMRASVAEEPDILWPDFIKTYIRGNALYGGPFGSSGDIWPGMLDGDYIIDSEDDTIASFTAAYPDLSAKIFLVQIDGPTLDSMSFETACTDGTWEDRKILVFGYKDVTTDHFLDEGYDRVTLRRIDTLQAQGWTQLWIAVVNSNFDEATYTGSTDIRLDIKSWLKNVPDYNFCLPWYEVLGTFTTITYNPPSPPETSTVIHLTWPNWEPVRGSFSGNVFTASWDTVDFYDRPYKGQLTVNFNSDYTLVTGFNVSAEVHRDFGMVDYIAFSGEDFPIYGEMESTVYYRVSGIAGCQKITGLSDTTLNYTGTIRVTLDQITCDSPTYAQLYFFKQE